MERLDKTATTYLCERPQKQTQRKKETVKLKPFCQLIEAKKKREKPLRILCTKVCKQQKWKWKP